MGLMYAIHSTVRARHNRTLRAQAPAHHRMKQHVGSEQARLVRSRPLRVTEEMLLSNLEEIKRKQAQGILEVRTPDGRLVDLSTMEASAALPVAPLPNPPLDSVMNDSPNVGHKMPTFPGGRPIQDLPPVTPESEEEAQVDPAAEVDIPADFMPDAGDDQAPDASEEIVDVQSQTQQGRGKGRRR